jgi:hypothetical protein
MPNIAFENEKAEYELLFVNFITRFISLRLIVPPKWINSATKFQRPKYRNIHT